MKNNKMIMFVMIALMLTLVTAQQMTRPSELPTLVYGRVVFENGTLADGADYTITSLDKDGNLLGVEIGKVGDMKEGMIFASQNKATLEGEKIIVNVTSDDGTVKFLGQDNNILDALESFKSYYDFGSLTLIPNQTFCGDGKVQDPNDDGEKEECDNGANNGLDGICSSTCKLIVPPPGELYLKSVRFISDEYLEIGEELITRAILDNIGETDLEGISVNILVPDLGLHKVIGPFDIDNDGRATKRLYVEIPADSEPGEYGVRIEISNDNIHRVVWRTFVVQ